MQLQLFHSQALLNLLGIWHPVATVLVTEKNKKFGFRSGTKQTSL